MTAEKTTVFFFAHQDDEFGVFSQIEYAVKQAQNVICVYLTNGETMNVPSDMRNRESSCVLSKLGVNSSNIHFVGTSLKIPDGKLIYHLNEAGSWVESFLDQNSQAISLYFPAWEGGHHDHDALHAMLVILAERRQLLTSSWQFSLYNAYKCNGPFFRVLSPLPSNGEVTGRSLSWPDRCRYLLLCFSYPSQAKSWLGLFPFVLLNYFFSGKQKLQPVSAGRVFERPHKGELFYEKRGHFKWKEFIGLVENFRELTALKLYLD